MTKQIPITQVHLPPEKPCPGCHGNGFWRWRGSTGAWQCAACKKPPAGQGDMLERHYVRAPESPMK